MYDIQKIREDFPILDREVYGKPLIYLDNGATTQKPRQVVEAITDEYYSVNANVHRGVHFLSQQLPSCMKLLVRLYVVLSMHAVAMKSCLHGHDGEYQPVGFFFCRQSDEGRR